MAIDGSIEPQAIVDFVMGNWERWKNGRKAQEQEWYEILQAYHNDHGSQRWVETAKQKGTCSEYFAAPYDAVENLASTINSQIFDDPQWLDLELEAHEEGAAQYDDQAAETLRKGIKYWFQRGKGKQSVKAGSKQLAMFGNVFWTVKWRIEHAADFPAYQRAQQEYEARIRSLWSEWMREFTMWQQAAQAAAQTGQEPPPPPQDFSPPPPPTVDPNVAYEGPELVIEDLFNTVIDPFAENCERPVIIRRTFIPLAQLKRLAEPDPQTGYRVYENVDGLGEVELASSQYANDGFLNDRMSLVGLESPTNRGVELYEAQGDMILAGPEGEEVIKIAYIATVANGTQLVRFEPTYLWSGRMPTQHSRLIPVRGEPYGRGLLGPAMPIARLINRRMAQIVDSVDVIVHPEKKAYNDGEFDPTQVGGPGRTYIVGDMNNLQPVLQNTSGVQVAMGELQMLLRWYQQVTRSANPYIQQGSEETATEVNRNSMLQSVSFNDVVEAVEDDFVARAMTLFVDHVASLTSGRAWALIDQEGAAKGWQPISPELLRKGWLVRVVSSKRATDQERRKQDMLMGLELMIGNPVVMQIAMQTGMIDLMELLKMTWEELGLPGIQRVFRNEPPPWLVGLKQMMALSEGDPNAPAQKPPGVPGPGAEALGAGPGLEAVLGGAGQGGGAQTPGNGNGGSNAPEAAGNGEDPRGRRQPAS